MPQKAPIWHAPRIGSPQSYQDTTPVRPSASERGYGDKRWEMLRRATFRRDNYLCQKCGRVCVEGAADRRLWPHADHILSKRRGGQNMLDNLQTLCGSCHSSKTHKEKASRHRQRGRQSDIQVTSTGRIV